MAFPTTSVLDDFNRADGNPGANWSTPVAFEGAIFSITSNTVTDNADGGGYWNPSTFGPDCEVYVDVPTKAAFPSKNLLLRVTSPGGTYDGYRASFGGNMIIRRVDDGVSTQLGATISVSHASGDSLGFEAIGSDLTVYKKTGGTWASAGTRSDATYGTDGYIGWFGISTDDRWDNFGGGTIEAAPPAVTFLPQAARVSYV